MRKMLHGVIAVLIGVTLATPLAWSADQMAQTTDKGAPKMMDKGEPGAAKQIEGKVEKVTANKVTLADGTELTIPRGVKVQRNDLKPGANVKAMYEEKGGQKVVTSLEVEPAR